MRVLVSGSIAYDSIMIYPGRFQDHILPDQTHRLNVSFVTSDLRREFGGCATNIAYGLKALGATPILLGAVGQDFAPYKYRLDKYGINYSGVRVLDDCYTAQAFITTDLENNQIAAFHPGAMMRSQEAHVSDIKEKIDIGIVSPNSLDAMLEHSIEFHRAGIPFIFDPGQGILNFSGEQLLECIKLADYVIANGYEATLLSERTGKSIEEIAGIVKALIVTAGNDGSKIYANNEVIEIPVVQADNVVDPTGCGDAYRAGLTYGILKGWNWIKTGKLAGLMGAIKVASRGGQNYTPQRSKISELFEARCQEHLD